jgi:hypothetical protein
VIKYLYNPTFYAYSRTSNVLEGLLACNALESLESIMTVWLAVECSYCHSTEVVKHGK